MNNYVNAGLLFITGAVTVVLNGGDLTIFLFTLLASVMLVLDEHKRQEHLRKSRQRVKYKRRTLMEEQIHNGRKTTETNGICA